MILNKRRAFSIFVLVIFIGITFLAVTKPRFSMRDDNLFSKKSGVYLNV